MMLFTLFGVTAYAAAAVLASTPASVFIPPQDIDVNDPSSIRSVASTLAYGVQSLYNGNITATPDTLAVFPKPIYWWEAGAAWGSMLDYAHYTGDKSYNDVITQALLSQVGPDFDFMVPRHYGDEGNDDQVFWSFDILAAAERNFPQPDDSVPSWLQIAINIWNSIVARWDTTHCNGGFTWQIFASNPNGLDYKNSVSNGGFFQLSARLARDTGNATYLEWANKVWDWSETVGFVDSEYNVYDGASSQENCATVNKLSFSYTHGIYLYGTAVMYNYTNGDKVWGDRTTGLLKAAQEFFSPEQNASNIMYEPACEPGGSCNTDMLSFKAYLSRFMWATTQMMPSTLPTVKTLLSTSAVAAAKACSGGTNGTVCGQKWYVGGFDGNAGLGQQMSALEAVHGLLAQGAKPPLKAGEIKHVRGNEPSSSPVHATTPIPSATTFPSAIAVTSATFVSVLTPGSSPVSTPDSTPDSTSDSTPDPTPIATPSSLPESEPESATTPTANPSPTADESGDGKTLVDWRILALGLVSGACILG